MNLDRLVRFFEDAVCVASLATIVVLVLVQVFYRYVLSSGILWIDELVTNLMIVTVMAGAARATRRGMHTDLRLLLNNLPVPLARALRVLGIVAAYAFVLTLVFASARYAWDSRHMKTTMIGIPLWIAYGTLPAGGLLILYELTRGLLLGTGENRSEDEVIP